MLISPKGDPVPISRHSPFPQRRPCPHEPSLPIPPKETLSPRAVTPHFPKGDPVPTSHHFPFPQRRPCPHEPSLPIPPPPLAPGNHSSASFGLRICPFWTFHVDELIEYVAFCVWLLSLGMKFSHFCCSRNPCFGPFDGQIIFHCVDPPRFIIHSASVDGHLGHFHPLITGTQVAGCACTGFV